jgi:aryl-alcohol dehydrogenase-like predicted oxidoreductase
MKQRLFGPLGLGGTFLGGFRSRRKLDRFLAAVIEEEAAFIDVAPLYFREKSELAVGSSAIANKLPVVSKAGVVFPGMKSQEGRVYDPSHHSSVPLELWREWFPPESLGHHLRRSLHNLKRSHLEGFLLHSVPPNLDLAPYGQAMVELKSQGLVRAIGFSSDTEPAQNQQWAEVIELPLQFALTKSDDQQHVIVNGILRETGFRLEESIRLINLLPKHFSLLLGTGKAEHFREIASVMRNRS